MPVRRKNRCRWGRASDRCASRWQRKAGSRVGGKSRRGRNVGDKLVHLVIQSCSHPRKLTSSSKVMARNEIFAMSDYGIIDKNWRKIVVLFLFETDVNKKYTKPFGRNSIRLLTHCCEISRKSAHFAIVYRGRRGYLPNRRGADYSD